MTSSPRTVASSSPPASFWEDSASLPHFPQLEDDLDVDVAVIGAGMTGTTTAYLLTTLGYRVALLDRGRVGGVDTRKTSAHLTAVTDERLHRLVDTFGPTAAKLVWEAGYAAIDLIVANIHALKLDCDFEWVPGYLHAPLDQEKRQELHLLERDAKLAADLGFEATYLDSVPMMERPGIRFDHQARIHPLKYLAGLVRAVADRGGAIFENTAVDKIESEPLRVTAHGHRVGCRYVVLATHTPLAGHTGTISAMLFQTKLALYTSYVLGARVEETELPDALFWDTLDPYHYVRIDRRHGSNYVIVGGEDHKTGQERDPDEHYRRLASHLYRILPSAKVDHHWSGQVIETADGLPLIGETAGQQFAATGFGGNGITFGTLGAIMAVDRFLGQANPWEELLSTRRKKIRGGLLRYLEENKDYPFYLVRNALAPAKVKSLRAVKRGTGAIVSTEGKKVAAYRDLDGKLTLRSPVCTHLGCIVGWNDAEKTWGCPCHGSRFTPTGQVLSGPAENDLGPVH